jgi:GntR family transcriptional regulator/MocR family aminotransferase
MQNDSHGWQALFEGMSRSGQSLQLQIRQRLIGAISEGRLPSETRLPSSRRLAAILGVGRNTVTLAYQQLLDDKVLDSRERSGIFVAGGQQEPRRRRPQAVAGSEPTPGTEAGAQDTADFEPRFAFRPSRMRQIVKPRDWASYPYPFLFGQFDPSLFPLNDWRESVRAASSASEVGEWSVDMIDDDDRDLVAEICTKILPRRGIWATPDEVTITLGAQQALYMLARLFAGPSIRVGIEDPCYPDLRNMLEVGGVAPAHLTLDRQGAVPDAVFASCDVVFLTPGHQCPTTVTMEAARREAILASAERTGALIVEDDYEADLFPEDAEPPALKSIDAHGHVVYVGSLSKALAPGLRLGFAVARPAIVEELRALRRMMLRHPPANNQRAMAMFIALGHHRSHVRRLGLVLAERARLIEARLDALPTGFRWRREPGATSFWITGPAGFDARAMALRAREAGVLVEPGDIFFADPQNGRASFRLGFAAIRAERIDAGIDRLLQAIAAAPTA